MLKSACLSKHVAPHLRCVLFRAFLYSVWPNHAPPLPVSHRQAVKESQKFQRVVVSRDEALSMFQENKFKVGGGSAGGRRRRLGSAGASSWLQGSEARGPRAGAGPSLRLLQARRGLAKGHKAGEPPAGCGSRLPLHRERATGN